MDPLSYLSFQPVRHDWCKKDVVYAILWNGFFSHYLNGPLSYPMPYNTHTHTHTHTISDIINYRGVTLLGCLGKLFMNILNSRLTVRLNDNKVDVEGQSGMGIVCCC